MGAVNRSGTAEVAGAHELFEEWAVRAPDRVAAVRGERELTYRELNTRADQLAARLRAYRVGPEVVVGLLLDRSLEMLVAVLAVWKAGGAYVPLCPSQPPSRTARALADTGAPVVVTDRDPAGLLPGRGEHVVRLDALDSTEPRPDRDRDPGRHPDRGRQNLAYVLYTSGSAGSPKGALVEHGGVVNLAAALRLLFGDLPGARVFQFAPPTFDAWVWELAMSLLNGATLCLPPGDELLCGSMLAQVLRQYGVTHLSASPSLLTTLPVADDLAALRTLVAGGEVLPEFLAARWASRLRLFNAYGPTEATVCATAGRCANLSGKPTIGRPLHGVDVHIVDSALQPLAVGEIGELLVGGAGVARGYLNLPELTAERFLPDHITGRPGARLYRTGDLARWLPNGELEFVGRMDDQIKLRGYRIEPGEVEEALRRHPRVTSAVVTTCDDHAGERRLCAYLEVPDAQPLPVPQLRTFLGATLPDHLVPSLFVTVERLPLTSHGKVDRAALPMPETDRPPLGHDYIAARGTLERQLAQLCAQLLGRAEVGVTDDFFALGGTSLDLVRLQEEVAGRWARWIPTADLVRAHNVRLLAGLLHGGDARTDDVREPGRSEPPVRHRRMRASQQLRSRRGKQ